MSLTTVLQYLSIMATPETDKKQLWGPVTKTRVKADLVEIAEALKLDFDKKKDSREQLAKKINAHTKKNPGLAHEWRFQGLFVYRKDKQMASEGRKKSTDKEAEDVGEASKPLTAPTGFAFTLLTALPSLILGFIQQGIENPARAKGRSRPTWSCCPSQC